MAIDMAEVLRIARLAHLEFPESSPGGQLFSEEQLAELRNEIAQFLEHVEDLQSVDVTGITPTAHGVHIPTRLRKDVAGATLDPDHLMASAPASDGHAFVVPKVVE